MNNTPKIKRPLVLIILCCLVIFICIITIQINILRLVASLVLVKTSLGEKINAWLDMPADTRPSLKIMIFLFQSIITQILLLISAIAMLKQKKWGRIFAITLMIFSFASSVVYGYGSIFSFGTIFSILFVVLLLLPSVNQYFRKELLNQ